jgi:hypothetical protein
MLKRTIVVGVAVLLLAFGAAGALAAGQGATDVAGTMLTTQCSDGVNTGVNMTGDLDGCWVTDVLNCRAQGSGTVECSGREHFVGSLGGKSGTLSTSRSSSPESTSSRSSTRRFVGAAIT